MSNPGSFKVVSFGTPSAFDPRSVVQKSSGSSNTECKTVTLQVTQGNIQSTVDLSGACTVLLPPNSGSITSLISSFTGCIDGQNVTFYNFNSFPYFIEVDGTNIVYPAEPLTPSVIVEGISAPVVGYCLDGKIYLSGGTPST